jgi:hypothetical protein
MFKFKIGDFVSSHPIFCKGNFMPGVGEVVNRFGSYYICELNKKLYIFHKKEIYEYIPY